MTTTNTNQPVETLKVGDYFIGSNGRMVTVATAPVTENGSTGFDVDNGDGYVFSYLYPAGSVVEVCN